MTDQYARVLRSDGSAIKGLYATGNATAPVIGASYPGRRCESRDSLTFGYVAARHALGDLTSEAELVELSERSLAVAPL